MGVGPAATNVDLLAILILVGLVAVRSLRNRPRPGSYTLAAFAILVGVWAGSHLLAHVTAATPVFRRLRWIGIAAAPVAWFLFVLEYTGRERYVTRRTAGLALAWPVALNLAIWLPDLARLVGVDSGVSVWTGVYAETSPLFWAHLSVSYGLFAIGSGLLLAFVRRAAAPFRRQAVAVLGGVTAIWLGSLVGVLELFGDLHVHALPAGLTLAALAFLWATTRGRLTDLMPVATETVLERLDAGVLVVDRDERVVEANPEALETFGLAGVDATVGRPLADLFADRPEALEILRAVPDREGERSHTASLGGRTVRVRTSTLRDGRGRRTGRVYLCDDVTERERRRAALRRQNEKLDRFAGIVSHDLRNPLNVATGRLELAREDSESVHLAHLGDALDRMEAIVDETLALARAGRTVDPSTVERVSLADLAAECWRSVDTGGADLDVRGDLAFEADPNRLRQLVENLFGNAVEHGSRDPDPDGGPGHEPESAPARAESAGDDGASERSPGGGPSSDPATGGSTAAPVTVRVGPLADGDGFYVEDDGPGIPADELGDVFDPGYSTAPTGPGLGLSIVAEVAQAHGWTVDITRGTDGGARFEMSGVTVGA